MCAQGDIRNMATEINGNVQVIHMFSFSLHSESKVKRVVLFEGNQTGLGRWFTG